MYKKSIKIGGREDEGGGARTREEGVVRFVCVSEFTSLSKFGFLTASICRSSFARLAARRFAWELLSAT